MAYPTIRNYTTGASAGNVTSTSITIPASTQAGDLAVLIFAKDGSAAPTTPANWNLRAGSVDSGSASYTSIFYRNLTAELTTFSVSHASEGTSWILLIFPGCVISSGTSTVARASSVNPNATSYSHNFAAGTEVMWVTLAGWDYNRTVSGYPSDCPDNRINSMPSSTGGAGCACATLSNTNASLDAGSFTISTADTWCAYTLAIKVGDPIPIPSGAITGITVPSIGNARDTSVDSTVAYTATIAWSPNDVIHQPATVYTGTVTLSPTSGYQVTGITANQFTASGSTSCTNSADSGVVTIVYPQTDPVIKTISEYTKSRISDETGMTTCNVTFSANILCTQWEARATTSGQTPGQGVGLLVGGAEGTFPANMGINFDVTYDELTGGDQSYRIDVYVYGFGGWH